MHAYMDVLRKIMTVSTKIAVMLLCWACLMGAPTWWSSALFITWILFLFFYGTQSRIPLPHRAHEVIMIVFTVILWALHMILLLSVIGILPFSFTFILR